MSTTAAANVAACKPVTLHDVAVAAGVADVTASKCLNGTHCTCSQATINRVRLAAQTLGYNKEVAAYNIRNGKKLFCKNVNPANPVFSSRAAETAAMHKLRESGHSNEEVAHRCGVSVGTVHRRIGDQPDEITAANLKLAGKVRAAKAQIKRNYEHQQLISDYNTKVEALNAEMAKIKQMASEIKTMQKKAASASKATGTPLLRLLPPIKIN